MTTQHSPATTTDTSVMPLIHTYFRREMRLAGGLVRGVEPGDVRRARIVADHLAMVGRHLHHHHHTEDRLLWPLLLQRVPDELAPIVHLMESQHEAVDALQGEIDALLPRWRATASADERDELGALHDRLYAHLVEHLDAEEERLLPIVARSVSQAEWEEMNEAGRAGTPRREMALTIGMFAYDGDPDVMAAMLAGAPAPVRWVLMRLARRAFARHAARVHGTPTP